MSIKEHFFPPLLFPFFAILLACTFASSAAWNFESWDGNLDKLADANNIFALNLHKALASAEDKNVFFSPLSVATVLSMLYYGVRGDSAKELRQNLGYNDANLPEESIHYTFHQLLKNVSLIFNNSLVKGFEMESANIILVDNHLQLHPEYKKSVQDLYMSPVRSVDFRTNSEQIKKSVNEWVESKTGGKIKELLKDVDPETVLVLLNAVYFKGVWKDRFKENDTRKDIFYNRGLDSPKEVDMMIKYNSTFEYYNGSDFQALQLPYRYKGEKLSMVVILPSSKTGLPAVEQSFTASMLTDIRWGWKTGHFDSLMLPKFKLEFEKDLVPELRNLGLKGIFKEGSDDFSGMMNVRDSRMLSVTDVIHKCELEVNEGGTERFTVRKWITLGNSPRIWTGPRYVFKADHPFMFYITEEVTGLILFMGRVSEL